MGSHDNDDHLEWKEEEGVPDVEDPFIQKYLNGRKALIAQEQSQRHGQTNQNPLLVLYFC